MAANTSTIAVLPFVDLSEDQDQEFFSDGLSEELIALLTKIPDLRVTARASSFAFRDRRKDITAIGRQLNVANVLDGSVRKSGNRLRFAVQLVQASTGTVVWSETYDREVKDIFELQEDVAGAVVEALKLRLLPSEHIPASERTANAQAYEQYLQGLKYGKESRTVDDMRRAMGAFEKAVALDPNFASGYAQIALVAAEIGGQTVDSAMYELARSNAERAMALSPQAGPGLHRARPGAHVQRLGFRGCEGGPGHGVGHRPEQLESAGPADQLPAGYRQACRGAGGTEARRGAQSAVRQRLEHAGPVPTWMCGITPMPATLSRRADQLKPEKWDMWKIRSGLELYAGNYPEALRQARMIEGSPLSRLTRFPWRPGPPVRRTRRGLRAALD